MTNITAAADSGVELTPRGLAYCLAHGREATERRIERHLALVTALLALIDEADGDPDIEDDDDAEPSLGGNVINYASVDCELDDCDDEPSLGSVVPSGAGVCVTSFAFLHVKPHWMSDEEWQRDQKWDRWIRTVPTTCQTHWTAGNNSDCEDDHDGRESDLEEGGSSWTEHSARFGGALQGNYDEDDEPSLGLPESFDQAARIVGSSHDRDLEADYMGAFGHAYTADQEGVDEDGGDVQDEPHDEEYAA